MDTGHNPHSYYHTTSAINLHPATSTRFPYRSMLMTRALWYVSRHPRVRPMPYVSSSTCHSRASMLSGRSLRCKPRRHDPSTRASTYSAHPPLMLTHNNMRRDTTSTTPYSPSHRPLCMNSRTSRGSRRY
ncbi:hypothetical protein WMY93_004720 [Mugilogobius chulae]|uniref:Uncharacterized protein n=1 Tax=Mugilogobius chulae TaxID=88201 RepID=A0AAW0PRY4_9GOBI